LEILLSQRSFAEGPACGPYSGNQVERMRGKCTFEEGQPRAAKASYSFQLFNLCQHINHIRLTAKGVARSLTDEERQQVYELAHEKAEVTFAQIRKQLHLAEDEDFAGIRYEKGERAKAEKNTKLKDLESYHKIRKCVSACSAEAFAKLSHDQLDAIGEALSKNQSDADITKELTAAGVSPEVIEALLTLPNFAKFGHLSVMACRKILPFLQQGYTYDKACEAAGYDFKATKEQPELYLPPLPKHQTEITSPVVLRAVSQTIKVINAIVREMQGSPVYLNIELARELAYDKKERDKIKKAQDDNAKNNEELMEQLREYADGKIGGQDLIKMKLWKEQDGRCMYSGEAIEIERLTEPGYVDVDHIVPYSICFDDRMANKVLVLTAENRQKGNRLPLQYLQGKKRDDFIIRVEQSHLKYAKKSRLLKESISDEAEWKQRNLQDTQFMASFLHRYIGEHLLFAPSDSGRKRRVTAVNGAITAYVRKRWGIRKIREDGDLHHAVDAVVIGCITQGMINRISRYSYYKETKDNGDYIIDEQTGEVITRFPAPWAHFLDELNIRMTENAQKLRKQLFDANYDSYAEIDLETVNPPFVSRMCNHKNTGSAHLETVRSGKLLEQGKVISKVALTALKLDDTTGEIANYYNSESDRLLYEALKERLQAYGGDGKKAFADGEFRKPKADGAPGPVVKKVKVTDTVSNVVQVQEKTGVANNEAMLRCDVFYVEDDGYYFVPIYVADTVKPQLPSLAPVAGKDADGRKRWKQMREEDFLFSLYPNDLIRVYSKKPFSLNVVNKKGTLPEKLNVPGEDGVFLYYRGMNISTAVLNAITHDNTYSHDSIGKTMQRIEKYEVDVLGNIHKVGWEKRKDFSHKKK
ncbi:MAG: type II CRISPR RNA-guided endonuclease Cas9, partial [Clostridia bacterium]|nr:type II CRISPR RNA-guided endonuclease Cas9 [Clostridia bacterium]